MGSTPTLEVDAAFIVRLVEWQTRSLEVAVSKDVKVQVLYRTPICCCGSLFIVPCLC